VNLYTMKLGNAQLPGKFKQWQSEQAAEAAAGSPSIFRRKACLIAAGALLIAGYRPLSVWFYPGKER
jgi:hypothetical protein